MYLIIDCESLQAIATASSIKQAQEKIDKLKSQFPNKRFYVKQPN